MVAMRGVELFAKGNWRGKPYTEADLSDIVTNFNTHQAPGPNRAMRVAMVKFHWPEDVKESRLPRHGTITRLYNEDGKLKYDADNVDPVLAKEIEEGKFEDISAEIYPEPPEGIAGAKGKMLRRVTFQGAEPPHVKGLNPLGLSRTLVYSELPTVPIVRISNRHGVYEAFSERSPVTRDEMIERLIELGMDEKEVQGFDDVQLAEIVKTCMGQGSATTESPKKKPGKAKPAKNGDKPVADNPNAKAAMTFSENDEVGEDKEAATNKYKEMWGVVRNFAEKCKTKFGDDPSGYVPNTKPAVAPIAPVVTFSEEQIKTALASVIADGKKRIDAEVEANQKAIANVRHELKLQRLETFAERELGTGRLEPADLDRGKGPNIIDRWMLLDDSAVVHKFTEDGKEKELTALDAELRAVRQKAPKYTPTSEKIPSQMPKQVQTFAEGSPEGRKAKFVAFAEERAALHPDAFSSPKEIIDAWELAKPEVRRELEKDLGFTGA
jgi:hypothetical protein